MEVSVEHLGGVRFEIKVRQHTTACDQPPEDGGYDRGMTPPQFLLASLGACVGFYAAIYLEEHTLSFEGTRVHVSAEKAKAPGTHGGLPRHARGFYPVQRRSQKRH